jgi:hypothetical protein
VSLAYYTIIHHKKQTSDWIDVRGQMPDTMKMPTYISELHHSLLVDPSFVGLILVGLILCLVTLPKAIQCDL